MSPSEQETLNPRLAPTEITSAGFSYLLALYPSTVRGVYDRKVKDSKKREKALEDDHWRYNTLVADIRKRRTTKSPGFLKKDELERLMQWKITHGTYRPTLPSLVRQNDPELVKKATEEAFQALSKSLSKDEVSDASNSTSLPANVAQAIKAASVLKGVGPATATLILSLFENDGSPSDVPFFEDELYEWLSHNPQTIKSLGGDTKTHEMEKVAYVIKHYVLSETEKKELSDVSTTGWSNTVETGKPKSGRLKTDQAGSKVEEKAEEEDVSSPPKKRARNKR